MTSTHDTVAARPRVEGDREQQILDAALDVLAELGYDRLTMDAVSARARASKATLYRRWNDKTSLVIDALISHKGPVTVPDTGTLRGDLIESFCGMGGLTDCHQLAIFASVLTAISRDEAFAIAFRRDFIAPKSAVIRAIFERALERAEIRDDIDLDLLSHSVPGIVLHRLFILGEPPDIDTVTSVIDQIVLPAARCGSPTTHAAQKADS